ncbi:bifunctional riboflavin kinase/FAD synthetase [Paramaledivibacter caminithermalis]|jgi:riboflavin kinase/FMN adenylyltransferase|uniref:Riboflavin biosynthesis protein n=1 Tax=Paramaledivibacter caminithermalis (strain DSM 15212 / CIP 107654 / DViRD3) TaxID=1121301 RepID=A0A1M6N550_PARC5|nr:bifunctional riboflavin kinase/FAD synthetase [Paramaledivibacter caminithermalis]SHJ90827.1 riboflavin kinase / FMN adenylyltransferase [Paramaledivibacter caminithermalis DSM 15212]
MEVIYSLEEIDKITDKTGVSLGSFDGLHKGHQTLINTLKGKCVKENLKSVIYTFSNHPRGIINFKSSPKLIINNNQKIGLLEKIGVDYLVLVKFDEFQKNIGAKEFVEKILLEKLNMSCMVVGNDCRFGKNAEGDTSLLEKFSKKYGFALNVVAPVMIGDEVISSTSIRNQLSNGLIDKANSFLGRKYSIAGKVIKGKQFGGKQGFPTANISIDFNLCLPKPGVYVTETIINNNRYSSITNVGFNPTFNQKNYNIETHIMNFNKKIYNEEITIEFLCRIRDEIKFNNVDDLYRQVNKDIAFAKDYFNI